MKMDLRPACGSRASIARPSIGSLIENFFADFLMLWLKRCFVPWLLKEVIAINVVYPTVLLGHGRSLELLPIMVCNILNGLRELHIEFAKVKTIVNTEEETIYKSLNPRVELLYMYMMAWLVLYYPNLMTAPTFENPTSLSYMQRYENFDWTSYYMSLIRKALWNYQTYQIYCSFSEFSDGNYGDNFYDICGSDDFTILSLGCFW